MPIRSFPCRMIGMALLWMAVGSVRPAARMPFKMGVGSPNEANVTDPSNEISIIVLKPFTARTLGRSLVVAMKGAAAPQGRTPEAFGQRISLTREKNPRDPAHV